jgi:hypothetical protein
MLFEIIIVHLLLARGLNFEKKPPFRWIEKTPTHANYIERILEFYPDVQILHIVRHPVPAIFSRKIKFPFNKETPIEILSKRWNSLQQNVERFKNRYPNTVLTLRYEDLVKNMNRQLETITDYLRISYKPTSFQCGAREAQSLILSSEIWKQTDLKKGGANTNETYKNMITKEDAEFVEKITATQMRRYGYRPFFD